MFSHESVDGIPFLKVLGTTSQVGWGPALYTYSVYVERHTVDRRLRLARQIDAILADERGWIRGGRVSFRRVEKGANTQVIMATPETVDRLCAPLQTEGYVSCQLGTKVVLNYERWLHAVPHWSGSIQSYRRMVVNHEWGHRIGKWHQTCPGPGKTAPVMQQQTYGLQGCKENSWPLDSEL